MADIPTVTDGVALDADLDWNPMAVKVNDHETRMLVLEADTDWTDLTLSTGFANFGTPYSNLAYRVIGGILYLRGVIKTTASIAAATTIATLPTGTRPSYVVPLRDSTNRIDVLTTGALSLLAATASGVNIIILPVAVPLG